MGLDWIGGARARGCELDFGRVGVGIDKIRRSVIRGTFMDSWADLQPKVAIGWSSHVVVEGLSGEMGSCNQFRGGAWASERVGNWGRRSGTW